MKIKNIKLEAQYGILIAFCILLLWTVNISFLLNLPLSNISFLWLPLPIILQTFLYTGLFIVAHDAMHGVVYPNNIELNHSIGSLCLLLYGLFPYKKLLKKHWLHHRYPATKKDPDFHNLKHKSFFSWYFHFMISYWNFLQAIGLVLVFYFVHYSLNIAHTNLVIFWIIPSILSSIQLFYFGTFLPHKEPEGGYNNLHCAQSNTLPIMLSFITCYHFGYHWEHHQYPNIPWWLLPKVRRDHPEYLLVE